MSNAQADQIGECILSISRNGYRDLRYLHLTNLGRLMAVQSGSPGLLLIQAMAFSIASEPTKEKFSSGYELGRIGRAWEIRGIPQRRAPSRYSRRCLSLAVLFTSTATASPPLGRDRTRTKEDGCNQKTPDNQSMPSLNPRSGRGGRRFKSCHSDHHLASAGCLPATGFATG